MFNRVGVESNPYISKATAPTLAQEKAIQEHHSFEHYAKHKLPSGFSVIARSWSESNPLRPSMELVRHPEGAIMIFFDEDYDLRIYSFIGELYKSGVLQFFWAVQECKGSVLGLASPKYLTDYEHLDFCFLNAACSDAIEDVWSHRVDFLIVENPYSEYTPELNCNDVYEYLRSLDSYTGTLYREALEAFEYSNWELDEINAIFYYHNVSPMQSHLFFKGSLLDWEDIAFVSARLTISGVSHKLSSKSFADWAEFNLEASNLLLALPGYSSKETAQDDFYELPKKISTGFPEVFYHLFAKEVALLDEYRIYGEDKWKPFQRFSTKYPDPNSLFLSWLMSGAFFALNMMPTGVPDWGYWNFPEIFVDSVIPSRAIPKSLSDKLSKTNAIPVEVEYLPLTTGLFIFEDWIFDFVFFCKTEIDYIQFCGWKNGLAHYGEVGIKNGEILPDEFCGNDKAASIPSMLLNLFLVAGSVKETLLDENNGDYRFNNSRKSQKKLAKKKNGRPISVWEIERSDCIKSVNPDRGTHNSPCTHWRRGHWAKQPCGKGLSKRKIIWRQPVLVNADNVAS